MFELGREFETYLRFMSSVKAGKKSIIIAKDYVIIDKKSYEKLTAAPEREITTVWIDEKVNVKGDE